jgi:hypothetical protein
MRTGASIFLATCALVGTSLLAQQLGFYRKDIRVATQPNLAAIGVSTATAGRI